MKLVQFVVLTVAMGAFAEVKDHPFPPSLTLAGQELTLNGVGMRLATFFNIKVYAAGLYLTKKARSPQVVKALPGPKVIGLYFLRNVDKDDISQAWRKAYGMQRFIKEVQLLNSYMGEMRKNTYGMQFQLYHDGLVVKVGEVIHPKIANAAFARAILDIYLGPKPPNEELKQGMLGVSR